MSNSAETVPVLSVSYLGMTRMKGRLKSAVWATGATAVFFGINAGASAFTAWFYFRILTLSYVYGWGHIPAEIYPISLTMIEPLFNIVGWVQIAAFFAANIAILVALTAARRGLEKIIGEASFYHGWGWTIGSLFIPFWSLYRPWVGFAEVRRAALGVAKRGRVSMEWKSDGFSFSTFCLALTWIFGTAALKALGGEIERTLGVQNFGVPQVEVAMHLFSVDTAIRLFIAGFCFWYLRGIIKAMQSVLKMSTSADVFN